VRIDDDDLIVVNEIEESTPSGVDPYQGFRNAHQVQVSARDRRANGHIEIDVTTRGAPRPLMIVSRIWVRCCSLSDICASRAAHRHGRIALQTLKRLIALRSAGAPAIPILRLSRETAILGPRGL